FIKRSVDLKPQFVTGSNNLGAILTRLGDYEQAIERFTHSLAMQPNNLVVQDRLKEARTHVNESKHFEFGPPVGLESLNDLSEPAPATAITQPSILQAKGQPSVEKVMNDAEAWLRSGQP